MKKHLLSLALTLCTLHLSAQSTVTYLQFGGGASTFSPDLDDLTPVPSVGIGFKAFESAGFSFCPAFLYQQRAQVAKAAGVTATTRMHVLQAELSAQYRTPPGFTIAVGYYHAIGLKSNFEIKAGEESTRPSLQLDDDIGLQASTGWAFKKHALRATYKNGLIGVAQGAYSRSFWLEFLYQL